MTVLYEVESLAECAHKAVERIASALLQANVRVIQEDWWLLVKHESITTGRSVMWLVEMLIFADKWQGVTRRVRESEHDGALQLHVGFKNDAKNKVIVRRARTHVVAPSATLDQIRQLTLVADQLETHRKEIASER